MDYSETIIFNLKRKIAEWHYALCMNQSFKKSERLKSRKTIGRLFNREGQSFAKFPLRLVYMEIEESETPIQFTVSVSKKKFKRAVDRNRVKRQIREAYRLHKAPLFEKLKESEKKYAWMVIFTGTELPDYLQVEKAMKKMITKFLE